MTRFRHIVAWAAVAAVALGSGCASTQPLAVEQEAPNFTLPNQDGKPVTLEQFEKDGHWVVLAIYTWAGTSN